VHSLSRWTVILNLIQARNKSDDETQSNCIDHRNYGPGRRLPLRTTSEQGLPSPRCQAPLMASACVHVMGLAHVTYAANTQPMLSPINVGTGEDLPIRELALLVGKVVGFIGRIEFDAINPDSQTIKTSAENTQKAV